MRMNVDSTFEQNYETEVLQDLPSTSEGARRYYYPGAKAEGGRDGVIVRVAPHDGEPWVGVFAFGYTSSKVISGVFSFPDPETICVVSAGAGYVVEVRAPRLWEQVNLFPLLNVRFEPERRVALFSDFTRLTAYGPEGKLWETVDLSWDGLSIERVAADGIWGTAWDSPKSKEVDFYVDLKTGNHRGGSSPQMYE